MWSIFYILKIQLKYMEKQGTLDKLIDNIFSMKKTSFYLILIFLLGFILRLIAAINLSVSADDMHFVAHAINFLSADRLITYDQSSGLWFAFTSIMFNIFGLTQLSSRLAALIFGSFSILVLYLLAREFFNEKIALISAFLLAIAPFHIKLTIAEMDVMAIFFSLLGMFLFIRALKSDKIRYFAISGLFIGLAVYTKVYPLLFIPSLLLFFIYYKRKQKLSVITKDNTKKIVVFLFIIFIFTIPALTHNYLLYKDKGFLDLQFTRTLGLGKDISAQYYAWDAQFDSKNSWAGLLFGDTKHVASGKPLLLAAVNFIRIGDPINFYLGLLGILIILFYKKEKRNYLIFFLLGIIFTLPFLASIILLPKHYVFLELLLIPMGALAIKEINTKTSSLLNKNTIKLILIILLILSLIFLGLPKKATNAHFYGKSHMAQMIEFKNENIPQNALIIGDSRIYRGQINWAFQGRPYLEGTEFITILNSQDQIPGDVIPIEMYYFECVLDDCGWGTIQDQPEFNASMEALTAFFQENGQLVNEISEPDKAKSYYPFISKDNKIKMINIYKATINMKSSVLDIANQPKNWFLYDIGYKPIRDQFDYYQAGGFLDTLLDKIAHWIVILALILAFLSPLYIIYLFIRK